MSDLYRIQQRMMAYLTTKEPAINHDITDAAHANASERLAIYGNAYGFRLHDALSENYPAVHTLLGDEAFYDMAYSYIERYPSKHFSLRYLGDVLEAFLQQRYPDAPVIAEMARFEWALRKAFDAQDLPALTLDALQTVAPEHWANLRFGFHPAVSRVDFEWNTPQLWEAIENNAEPIPPEQLPHPYAWLIWREGLFNPYRSLDVDEAWALDAALAGDDFATLCAGICEWIDEAHAPARIAGFLHAWIDDGLLVALNYDSK